uniref:Uncharacterized protein n=1 Tax=Anguilla anguilla TaxID=7936 RepID=A0A0E9P6U1_ANGAN
MRFHQPKLHHCRFKRAQENKDDNGLFYSKKK